MNNLFHFFIKLIPVLGILLVALALMALLATMGWTLLPLCLLAGFVAWLWFESNTRGGKQ